MTLSVSTEKAKIPTKFNRNPWDIKDPVEFAGFHLLDFSRAHIYEVVEQPAPAICDELYSQVLNKLAQGAIGEVESQVIDYWDSKHRKREAVRKYIVIKSNTIRGTNLTIFLRFLPVGKQIYLGIDSYALGKLTWRSWLAVLIRFIFSSVVFFFGLTNLSWSISTVFLIESEQSVLIMSLAWLLSIFVLAYSPWHHVLRAFWQHWRPFLALRQNLFLSFNTHSFNEDDLLIFFKGVLPLVLFSVKEVFNENDIPIQSLDQFAQEINQAVHFHSEGGPLSIVGSIIGGTQNKIVRSS